MSNDAERNAQVKKIQQQSVDAAMERHRVGIALPIMQPKPLPVPKFNCTSVTIPSPNFGTTKREFFK